MVCYAFEVNAISVNFTKESGINERNEVDVGSAVISEDEELLENDTNNIYDGNNIADYEDLVILFEGDIEIPLATLRKYYEINETIEKELMLMRIGSNEYHMSKRAATSDEDKLWTSKVVPYVISSAFTSTERAMIMDAMDTWSEATCISFVQRESESDYIHFVQGDRCSSYIGRIGGQQYIWLHDSCSSHRTVLHEIGHALGLWHEQSRPDRDSYVTYHEENVIVRRRHNFMKKKDKQVDYQGTEYDYGSVMHYHERAFVRPDCTDCRTITINNNAAYERQGRPRLGSEDRISSTDITQVKRLYRCSGRGECGLLVLNIRYGKNLQDIDIVAGDPDPYVEVKAITSNGVEYTKKTLPKQGTQNPTWNEQLVFSIKEWQFFRIRVWDNDLFFDDPMGMSETVPLHYVASFTTRYRTYCTNTDCDRYISYSYRLVPKFTDCTLRVKVRYARNLSDTDPILNNPDPYVVVEAFTSDTSSTSRRTSVKRGTTNPTWNEVLCMSGREFARLIKVQVFDDDDICYDDEMSTAEYIDLLQYSQSDIRHCVTSDCSAYLILDIEIIPILNQRTLEVTVMYGRNIPDRDALPGTGESDPYVRVTAYKCDGERKIETTTKIGDKDPDWNETLNFGQDIWTKFVVSVWDADFVFDDRLSDDYTVSILTTGSISSSFTVYTNDGGYVELSYTYR